MDSLLLLHGATGSKQQLEPLNELLKPHFNVVALNFEGHGGEPLPAEFSIQLFAENVIAYLNNNNIAQTHIFGYSLGGYVAVYLAKHHSDRINKIATFATKFVWTETIAEKEAQLLNPEKIKQKLPKFAEILARQHYPQSWEELLIKTADLLINFGKNNYLSLKELQQIKTPVLLASGDKDVMVIPEETLATYRTFTNANLWIIPDTQHAIEKIEVSVLAKGIIKFFNI